MMNRSYISRRKLGKTRGVAVTAFALLALSAPPCFAEESRFIAAARHAERVGDFFSAHSLYQRAIMMGEPKDNVVTSMARMLVKQGRTNEARDFLKNFLELENPFHVDARIALGEIYLKDKEYQQALREIDLAERVRPDYLSAVELKGVVFQEQGENDRAIRVLGQYLAKKPGAFRARLSRAKAYLAKGQTDIAKVDLKNLQESYQHSIEVVDLLGEVAFAGREYVDAEKYWKQALSISTRDIRFLEKMGDVYVRTGRFYGAVDLYSEGISKDPTKLDLGIKLAKTFLALNDREKAIRELRRILGLNAGYDIGMEQLLAVLLSEGRFDLAASALKEWNTRFPDRAWIAVEYSKVLVRVDRTDLALQVLEKSTSLENSPEEVWIQYAYTMQVAGQPREAIDILADAQKRFPDSDAIHYNLGVAFQRVGYFEDAAEKFKEIPPRSPYAYKAQLGLISMQKPEEAPAAATADLNAEKILQEKKPEPKAAPTPAAPERAPAAVEPPKVESQDLAPPAGQSPEPPAPEKTAEKPAKATKAELPKKLPEQKKETVMKEKAKAGKKERFVYTEVRDGETLQSVSKRMLGTTKKWHQIYLANRSVIKNPSAVEKGLRIKVPVVQNEKSRVVSGATRGTVKARIPASLKKATSVRQKTQ